ncbi:hypothetical protein SCUP234_08617 [Seiridium cupressi]
MVSSSQATTASADASDDDNNQLKREATVKCAVATESEFERARDKKTAQHDKLDKHDKHNRLEATVKWVDGRSREQLGLMFDLQYHAAYNTAFFKLRFPVTIKSASAAEQISLFAFLAPEAIETLSVSSDHAQELGPDTVCLRFKLKSGEAKAPALVVPKTLDPSHSIWNTKRSSDVWASVQSLARTAKFDILCRLPRRVMSEARIQSLCEALSNDQVSSTPGYADLGGLYGGKGGKVVRFEVKVEGNPSEESPPAYQDLEPGPPMPPILQDKTSNKRRRGNSDTDSPRNAPKSRDHLEDTVAWLVTELKEHKTREALLITELQDVKEKVEMLISRQSQHEATCATQDSELHDDIAGLEAKVDELDNELEIRVDCRIDETLDQKSDNIKEELVEYIEEALPNRIQGALEEVTFSARF